MNTPPSAVDQYGLSDQSLPKPVPVVTTVKRKGRFLKGPIPLDWLQTAADCRGKAMVVAMLLWYRRGVTGSLEVNVGRELRRKFSVSPSTFRRALADLERRGLLTVQRGVGRSPCITILDPPVDAPP